MTTYNGIECPCYGTLEEIHKALVNNLKWHGNQVAINGHGYTVTEMGFRSNQSEKEYSPAILAEFPHTGTAILIGLTETGFKSNYEGDLPDYYEIVTSGKVPHISKRCAGCGCQLNQEEIKRGACNSCYAETVNR